jgi:hypothetical protein
MMMSRLKLRVKGEEKGTYTEESVAFGNAFWDLLQETAKKKRLKQSRVLNEPVEQFKADFPQGEI